MKVMFDWICLDPTQYWIIDTLKLEYQYPAPAALHFNSTPGTGAISIWMYHLYKDKHILTKGVYTERTVVGTR